jgi:FG-GAP-like repeat
MLTVSAIAVAGCNLGSAPVIYPAPSRVVEALDVNGDGAIDVVSAGPGSYAVLLNDGAGGLHGSPVASRLDVQAFALGDVDRDGAIDRVDLHRSPNGASALYLLRGDGSGAFGRPEALGGVDARDVDLVDLDNDGDLDVLTTGRGESFLQVRRNDGTGQVGAPEAVVFGMCGSPGAGFHAPLSGLELTHADMTNDGWQDVVVGAICERETSPFPVAYAVYNNGAGGSSGGTIWGLGAYGAPAGLAVGDIDEDGVLDVVVGGRDDASVTVLAPVSGNRITVPTPDRPGDVGLADIDQDAHVDIVATAAGHGRATVLFGDGTGGFAESHTVETGGDVVDAVTTGRLDPDGSTDLVFGNDSALADAAVAVLFNTLGRRQH